MADATRIPSTPSTLPPPPHPEDARMRRLAAATAQARADGFLERLEAATAPTPATAYLAGIALELGAPIDPERLAESRRVTIRARVAEDDAPQLLALVEARRKPPVLELRVCGAEAWPGVLASVVAVPGEREGGLVEVRLVRALPLPVRPVVDGAATFPTPRSVPAGRW